MCFVCLVATHREHMWNWSCLNHVFRLLDCHSQRTHVELIIACLNHVFRLLDCHSQRTHVELNIACINHVFRLLGCHSQRTHVELIIACLNHVFRLLGCYSHREHIWNWSCLNHVFRLLGCYSHREHIWNWSCLNHVFRLLGCHSQRTHVERPVDAEHGGWRAAHRLHPTHTRPGSVRLPGVAVQHESVCSPGMSWCGWFTYVVLYPWRIGEWLQMLQRYTPLEMRHFLPVQCQTMDPLWTKDPLQNSCVCRCTGDIFNEMRLSLLQKCHKETRQVLSRIC